MSAVVSTAVAAVHFTIVGGQVSTVPVAEIAYQRSLLIAIGALIVLTIVGAIVTAIVTAIGTAVTAEITGEGSVEDSVTDIGRSDERDKDIHRRGELIGYNHDSNSLGHHDPPRARARGLSRIRGMNSS